MDPTILIIEDEVDVREMIAFTLEDGGYRVIEAADVDDGIRMLADSRPDLLLLDWMLPGISGLELLRRLRKNDTLRETPVIMLTARGEEIDRVRGLENGADDYITKPFSTKELLARIKTVLRRTSPHFSQETVTAGALRLDSSSHRVSVDDEDVILGPTEFKLLQFFMTHPDRVYARAQILDNVWGMNVYVEERTVDVHIRRLRKALEPHRQAHLIQTVRGYGYRFSSQ